MDPPVCRYASASTPTERSGLRPQEAIASGTERKQTLQTSRELMEVL